MKTAVLVVDVINDFVTGKFGSKRNQRIVPNIQRLLKYVKENDMPVVYVTDAHRPGDNEFEIWDKHAIRGSQGAKVVDVLSPKQDDHRVLKRRYSAFFGTDLDLLLRELAVDTLMLTGLVTNICIQHTAADAFFRGYKVVVPRDCVEAASEESQRHSLDYMREMYNAEITTSMEIMEGGLL